jgi:hypothetical protein
MPKDACCEQGGTIRAKVRWRRCAIVRQHEHQLVSRAWRWANDDEIAEPEREHLLVLSAFTAQLGQRVGFDATGAALGGEPQVAQASAG